jgi:hypothetical protein
MAPARLQKMKKASIMASSSGISERSVPVL